MPLRKGHSQEVISENIKQMVRNGKKPKEAIAAALANARASRMAMGGMVESQMDSDDGSDTEPGTPTYPMHDDEEGLSPNVMSEESLASALQAQKYAANQNTVSYEADDMLSGSKMSKSGQTQPEAPEMNGTKPDLDWINDGTAEPMSDEPMKPSDAGRKVGTNSALTSDAMEAIRKKREKRKYV